ncbi:MAG: aconitate hydratase [Candidatus Omnitrophica bacterium]|nr:aconitate hydratase [Candidatus Omnitrophota bacterium]
MGFTVVQKILKGHLRTGSLEKGAPLLISVDQALTQDATGTAAYLQFEAMGLERIQLPLAVSYIDHNILQTSFMNADDHRFLQTAAAKYGAYFSSPGNGICHQVHLERFAAPGTVLLGSDSHTPTAGGMGALAIGVGGLDVATAMAGQGFDLAMPEVVLVRLTGKLNRPAVTAMDVILELLRRLSVKGGVGKIFEYGGGGVKTLSVTERATITNMGAELGATTSLFPSDENTRHFLSAQKREKDWARLEADPDAAYDSVIEIDLSGLVPLVALPHSPDNVKPVSAIAGEAIDQVCLGSCTNSSFQVLREVAGLLSKKTVHKNVSLTVSPGSKQAFEMISAEGLLGDIVAGGARILESACGPCIGMGQTPATGAKSVRTFNRNFHGRCGNPEAGVYLASHITATLAAVAGRIVDPLTAGLTIKAAKEPDQFLINDNLLIAPQADPASVTVQYGPNIKPIPVKEPLEETLELPVILKTGDNITTDDIMPAGSKVLPLRSNIPAISEYVFSGIDPQFVNRIKKAGRGVIIGGENYGQGSSREHAAIAPMFLGVKAVIAKSFARIHKKNLINFGILPLTFKNSGDYDLIEEGQTILLPDIKKTVREKSAVKAGIKEGAKEIGLVLDLSDKETAILLAGGLFNLIKKKSS